MPGTFTYGLYPWTWDAAELCHKPPVGAVSVLDLRRLGQQGFAGPTDDESLFAWPDGVSVPNDLVSLGTGYIATLQPSTAARNELRLKLGLAKNPAGATLVDCIADVLGALSDPTGATGPKPLMPSADGSLEILLAGHSRVWTQRLTMAALLSANPAGKLNRIRDVIRADLDIADAAGKLPEALGHWLMRCGYSREEIKAGAPGRKSEYDRLCSAAVKAKHGSDLKPKEPKTQLVETWPTDSSITSGQVYAWTIPTGGTLSARGITAVSGKVRQTSPGDSFFQVGRCESVVSSADHWSIAPLTIAGNYGTGTCARFAAAAGTCYFTFWWFGQGVRHSKLVAGVETVLGTNSQTGGLSGVNCKCDASGSTITGTVTGYAAVAVTDPAITGNLRGGVVILAASGSEGNAQAGAVTIGDGIPAAPVAAFSGTPLSGTAPLSVAFTYSGTGGAPDTYAWQKKIAGGSWVDFEGTPTAANPTEVFTTGVYDVRVTVSNAGGSNTKTETDYVVVAEPPAPEESSSGHTRRTLTGLG